MIEKIVYKNIDGVTTINRGVDLPKENANFRPHAVCFLAFRIEIQRVMYIVDKLLLNLRAIIMRSIMVEYKLFNIIQFI